jgi:membrane-associated phospholipid phosphatase
VIELLIAVVTSVAAGVAAGFAVAAFPHADPAAAASRELTSQMREHGGGVRRFVRSRLDPEAAAGLGLTLALVGVVVVFVVFGVVIAMVRANSGVVSLDVTVTRWAAAHATSFSLSVFGWVTQAGSTVVVVAVAVATSAYAWARWRRWSVALFFLVVLGGQLALSNLVKVAVERVRPDMPPLHVLSGPSFPSGHATAAAATWAAVALVVGRGASPRARAMLAGSAVAIAVAVACSRVFLGAHWTSDVVGGLLLGWTWFALCAVAFGGRVMRLGEPLEKTAPGPARAPSGVPSPGGTGRRASSRRGVSGASRLLIVFARMRGAQGGDEQARGLSGRVLRRRPADGRRFRFRRPGELPREERGAVVAYRLTASFDHDIVDGAQAARFVSRFAEVLSSGDELRELAIGIASGGAVMSFPEDLVTSQLGEVQ